VGLKFLVSSGLFSANATEYKEVLPQPLNPIKLILISRSPLLRVILL
jgi:hypothetical protein